jgi:tetratricopeptide (TPR) repeat protein
MIDGIIFISTYPCGIDSLVNTLAILKNKDLPTLNLKIDENITELSLETKLELYAGLWNNMAYTLEKIGDSNGAQKAYEKAIEVLSRLSMFSDLAVSYVNLAGLYFNTLNNKEKAMEYLTLALDIFNSNALIKDSYYAHTCKKCAGAFTDMGYPEIAEDLQKRANEIYERNQQK